MSSSVGSAASDPSVRGSEHDQQAQDNQANQPALQVLRPSQKPAARPAVRISQNEALQLLGRFETARSSPDDEANAKALARLQADGLRGMPTDAIDFETTQTLTRQRIEALSQRDRDRFNGMQAQDVNSYESATSATDRQKIAQAGADNVSKPVNAAYAKVMADPVQHIQQEFSPPFGAQYLGAAGQEQVALLAQMRAHFNEAKTVSGRESLFRQAASIRHDLQQQIADRIAQTQARTDQQWRDADKALYAAQDDAKGLQIATTGNLDDTSSFRRLDAFARNGLTSQRNAQELQYRMQQNPGSFKDVKQWNDDAASKSAWARSTIQSDPFRRSANLPPPPMDLTKIESGDLHMGDYGQELLDRDLQAAKGIDANRQMYHAASQRGPIRNEYLDAHTPPKPLWQQQTEDVLGRFFVGLIPGVNLFTNLIVPANSLSPDAKLGIDIMSGVLGTMLGEAKLPSGSGSKVRAEGDVQGTGDHEPAATHGDPAGDAGHTPAADAHATGGGAADAAPRGAGAPAAAGPRTGIPDVPDTYASKPHEALAPDPQFRGIYRDGKGNAYIQQSDRTYAVTYDKDNGTWQINSPYGGTKPQYAVRLNDQGNWEINPDTGLLGGGPKRRAPQTYSDALGREAYTAYYTGSNYAEVARELRISNHSAKEWIFRYAKERGASHPYSVSLRVEMRWMKAETGEKIYSELSHGTSLQDVARKYTDGNTLAAFRSAMRYTKGNIASTRPVVLARLREVETGEPAASVAPPNVSPRPQPQVEPMSRQQYEQIQQRYDAGQSSPEVVALETGLPEQWVRDVEHGYGYYSPSRQAYVEPIDDPAAPPSKRPRTESTQPEPQAGPSTSGAVTTRPGWGRNEVRLYIDDADALASTTRQDIYAWLNEDGPVPAGLQQEMIDQGFSDLTPDLVREYLDPHSSVEPTTRQYQLIEAWLGL